MSISLSFADQYVQAYRAKTFCWLTNPGQVIGLHSSELSADVGVLANGVDIGSRSTPPLGGRLFTPFRFSQLENSKMIVGDVLYLDQKGFMDKVRGEIFEFRKLFEGIVEKGELIPASDFRKKVASDEMIRLRADLAELNTSFVKYKQSVEGLSGNSSGEALRDLERRFQKISLFFEKRRAFLAKANGRRTAVSFSEQTQFYFNPATRAVLGFVACAAFCVWAVDRVPLC